MTTKRSIRIDYQTMHPDSDIRISNQFLITRALHFAQPLLPYYPTLLSSKCHYHIGSQSII